MSASHSLPLLERARVASPCPMKWDDLTPTAEEAIRHCQACGLNVHNFADLSTREAERLLQRAAETGERLCGVLWRRADGTIITKNCPVGWRAARQRAVRAASRAAAAIGMLLTGGLLLGAQRDGRSAALARLRSLEPFRTVSEWISPTPAPPPTPPPLPGSIIVVGDICVTPPPAHEQNGAILGKIAPEEGH